MLKNDIVEFCNLSLLIQSYRVKQSFLFCEISKIPMEALHWNYPINQSAEEGDIYQGSHVWNSKQCSVKIIAQTLELLQVLD